ncbi:MAG: penicillin acylase family protein [Planctomycetota bacterium]
MTHQRRRRLLRAALVPFLLTGALGFTLTSCVAVPPPNGSIKTQARLDAFPTEGLSTVGRVEIDWDERLIPYIHADDERDVPYAMGLVHAHLRLGSMELVRKISQGRVSEMAGPFTGFVDESIRALDLDRAVPQMERDLPAETRDWIERYCSGINDYKRLVRQRSADFKTLGFDDEPWTVRDVLTFGRLACVDINVGRWLALLPKRGLLGSEDFERRLLEFGARGVPSFGPAQPTPISFLTDRAKSGSNCFVVGGGRAGSGSGMLAADPHLGLPQPNVWCVVGYSSPAGSVVGLTIPALPFVLIGRNESIAWGGTNMQNLASTLYDASDLPTTERTERIERRWWFSKKVTLRETELGPVMTDGPLFESISEGPAVIRWNGHSPTDEASAFLRVSKASSFDEFRSAFATYGAGGQNFLYADAEGNIGQVLATRFHPVAARLGLDLPADPSEPGNAWDAGIPSDELPFSYNPADGFLVSANNTPVATDPPLLTQGNANDRVLRMRGVLSDSDAATTAELYELQRDVFSEASLATARAMVRSLDGDVPDDRTLLDAVATWDGRYAMDSRGAAVYMAWLRALIDSAYADTYDPEIVATLRQGPYVHAFVLDDIESGRIPAAVIRSALIAAADTLEAETVWGDLHRFRAQHPLAALPVLGGNYKLGEWSSPGTLTTVYKAAHGVRADEHAVTFGANARFLTDLADPDSNHVVLLGGQDGFLGSEHVTDQVNAWFAETTGDDPLAGLTPLPLSRDAQRARSIHTHRLGASNIAP